MKRPKQISTIIAGLALALAFAAPKAQANVFASNIKINGALTNAATAYAGSGATITYILNEPASLGVAVQILSGTTPIRTLVLAAGSAGTTQGLNTVAWDGKDDSNAVVPPGNYSVQVIAQTTGYSAWTKILNITNSKLYWGTGIAVDTKLTSPYYGRIMVANGCSTAQNTAAHPVGIVKFNADGSEADEGQSTPAGAFRTDAYNGDSIRSLKYGEDDRVYWDDWVGNGKVSAADMTMTTSQVILDTDLVNGGANGNFSSIDVTGAGTTNALVWFADDNYPPSGVWCWPMTNNGVADPTFGGINVVGFGPDIPVRAGRGMMITDGGDIFIGDIRSNSGDTNPKLTAITNVWGASFGYSTNWWNNDNAGGYGFPILSSNLGWQDGALADDTWLNSSDVAIDSRTSPKNVAQTYSGSVGGLKIVNAADGTLVTALDQNSTIWPVGTCFDAVGNVYASTATGTFVAYSPPGNNGSTTPAAATLQVTPAPVQPVITSISVAGSTVTIHFTGGTSDAASAFTLLSSGAVKGSYAPASGASISGSAGAFTATVTASGNAQFYRIKR